jgi:hypothetical protein
MDKSDRHMITLCLLALLFAISFFKDDFSPDYLNTPDAAFLGDLSNRPHSVFDFPLFWISAFAYSCLFCVLPYYTLKSGTNRSFAKTVAGLFLLIMLAEYLMILLGNNRLDTSIIPKVNRFYHSPIFTLFFLAAFTINNRLKEHG